MRPSLISAAEAAALITDKSLIAIQGAGGGTGEPTSILRALRARFDATAFPRELTLLHATGLGDKAEIGTDLLAVPGLVKTDIAGHLAMAPKMGRLIRDNLIGCHNLPQGVISHLYRAIAARQPGVITKTGLHTFVDPRIEGGRVNACAGEPLMQVIQLAGEEWLFYPSLKIDVALVRGTTADLKGNISAEEEAAIYEGISIAQAAKASGGIVVAQVKRIAMTGSLNPREVVIPGVSVDYIVVDEGQKQTCLHEYDPSLSGGLRIPLTRLPAMPLDARKIVARRAARELLPGSIINVGVGMPDGVARVVAEERGSLDDVTFTIEQGLVGGQPAGGVIFGVSHNPEARLNQSHQFDFYDGGGLDVAFLGMAETDRAGNVNVSKMGDMLAGCGGFINISQNARRVVFCGTFTAKGVLLEISGGQLHIHREGTIRKFVQQVQQITFSGRYAGTKHQPVLYVTERAVFRLGEQGLILEEIAPGIDLERDVLGQMGFRPQVSPDLRLMDETLFRP